MEGMLSFLMFFKTCYDVLRQVEQAVREIKRLLVEASAAALQAEYRNPSGTAGRYSVI